MKKRNDVLRFILKCIFIPAAAILIILCLNRPYSKIHEQQYSDLLKFGMLGTWYGEIHIANLGSSHGAYDFLYNEETVHGYVGFNFANTSQSYDYDYAILKTYSQYMEPDSVLFIPVSYFSYNNEVINETEAEALKVRYYQFLPPENIPDYDPYVDLVTHKLSILSAGEDILKLFPKLHTALTAQAAGDGVDEAVFAEWASARYSRHFDNKEEYFLPERTQELYDIIAYCQAHEITPVLITTPFSKPYLDLVSPEFLEEFRAATEKIASDTGVSYYDYSHDERFYANLEYFSDADHLNEEGALFFMSIIWEEVAELGRYH